MKDLRISRRYEEHVKPLSELLDQWAMDHAWKLPSVDPDDGGVNARALFLLESPGPRAVGTGFVSRNNPDPSARNMGASLDQAGLRPKDVLLWNVVPFYVSDEAKNRNASLVQVREAAFATQAFIDRLPELRAVVFGGRRAQQAIASLTFPASVEVFSTFHPAARSYWRKRDHIHRTFRAVARHVSAELAGNGAGAWYD